MANTYGANGNRWWVAINTGSDSTFSGADPFGAPGHYQAVPSGNATDDALFAGAAGKGNTVSIEHILWSNVNGPFPSQTAANKAINGIQAKNPAPGLAQQFGAPFSSVQNALTAFYRAVTNGKMWRSLGWIVLGLVMIIMGVSLWIKGTITPADALALAGVLWPKSVTVN